MKLFRPGISKRKLPEGRNAGKGQRRAVVLAWSAVVLVASSVLVAPGVNAQAVGSDAWFDNVVPNDSQAALSADVLRVRHTSFDANAAVASLVSPVALGQARQGERVEVKPSVPAIQVATMDDRVLDVAVNEVAVTQPYDGVAGKPEVQMLGSTVLSDGTTTTTTFSFVPDANGKYVMAGSVIEPALPEISLQQVSGNTYALIEEKPSLLESGGLSGGSDVPVPVGGASAVPPAQPAKVGDNYVIDVLVGYGPGTGVSRATTRAEIASWMNQTNQAFFNSRMNVRVNLLESMYVEYNQDPLDMDNDIERLRLGAGNLSKLHQRRDVLGADLVALIVPVPVNGTCGLGWVPAAQGTKHLAYSVSARGSGCTSGYTFAHELGHNLGADHNPENSDHSDKPYNFSYGNTMPGVARTVMGYWQMCPYTCPVQLQFSNPAVPFLNAPGVPSGVAEKKDNARSITAVAPYTSNYRGQALASDVAPNHKFYTEIKWMLDKKIATGYADGSFRPAEPVSREATAAFLYRYSGSPAFTPPKVSPFKDVPTSSQFYKHVTWLASKGITTGYADGTFKPKDPVSRDAMSVFLYRLKGKPAFTPPAKSPFTDVATTYKFYKEITWLRSTGITTGNADGTFAPLVSTSRADMSVFLYRYNVKFGK